MLRMHCTGFVAIASVLTAAASAQSPLRFDMGASTSPGAAGYTQVTPTSTYSAAAGFGWTAGTPASAVQTSVPADIPVAVDPALILDGIESYTDLTFAIDVPNGQWQCVVWLGNVGGVRPQPRENLDITCNGVPVAIDLQVRTLAMKASFLNALGGYRRVPFQVTVTGGRIDLVFHCDGAVNSRNSILAIEAWPHVPAPITFDHGSRTLVPDPAHAATLAPALALFNAHDYTGARNAIAAIADPRLRAWGQAWLLGWFTGDEIDVDLGLLAQAKAALIGLASPNDISVAGLLTELQLFERADFYNRARGYTLPAVPGSMGELLKNLCAAGLLFDNFRGDTLGTAAPWLPASPLYAKARYLQARNMYGRNTLVNDPNNPFTADFLATFAAVNANLDLFPKAAEQRVMGFLATSYAIPGGLWQNWTGPASVPGIVPATTWWAQHIASAASPAAPRWANMQRRYLNAFRNCGKWWMTRRLIAGEIGGGDGDDVEGAGILGLPSVIVSEPGHPLENGTALVMDKVLNGPAMNVAQGYFANCGDVEHSAEYSTNPLYILLCGNYGAPRYVEYALRTLRNMDNLHDPAPWTMPDGIGGRHFRAYNLGATTVCGASLDIPLNMRAAVPGFAIGDYSGHPRVVLMFDELARAWAQHALSAAGGKPAGVFPAAVNPAPPYVFGTGGQWWSNQGYVDIQGGPQYHSYLYALLLSAYAHSTAPDRHVFLQPFHQAALFLYGYRTGTVTGTAPGTPGWAANLLKGVIADGLAQARGLMIADPNLALPAADIPKIDTAINAYASAYEKHVALPVVGTKPKTSFENTFTNAATWMDYFWPIASTTCSYTDRIFCFVAGSQGVIFGSMTGASTWGILPPSVITWTNPNPAAGPLDFAALVNDIQSTGMDVLVYHFGAQPRDFGLRLWRRLPAGQYEARIGNDLNHDDTMDGPPHTIVPFMLANPGLTVTLPGMPNGALQKIEIRQIAPAPGAPALLPDPALGLEDVVLAPSGAVTVTVHNLGSAPVNSATVEVVQNNTVVGSAAVPAIAAPLDYAARTSTVVPCCLPLTSTAPVTVRIVLPVATAQVTPLNDSVTFAPPGWAIVGAGCPGGGGVPAMNLVALPQLGGTYSLGVQNLGGGFAFMAIGLTPQNIPLQPLGIGFGPGCFQLVTLEVATFLVQTAGTSGWSMAIPNNPLFSGQLVFNQVAELGPGFIAAVSAASQAEIH